MNVINVDGHVDHDDMPLCPLCDQPIFKYEEFEIITAINTLAIAHKWCVEELQN